MARQKAQLNPKIEKHTLKLPTQEVRNSASYDDTSSFLTLWTLFEKRQMERGNSKKTIVAYKDGFNVLCEFLGIYLATSVNVMRDVSEYQRRVADELMAKIMDEDRKEVIKLGYNMPIALIDTENFDLMYRKYLESKGIKPASVQTYLRAYRTIAYFAMDEELIPRHKISIKVSGKELKVPYTEEEIALMLQRPPIDEFANYRTWVIVSLIMSTGLRSGAVCALRIKDIDLKNRVLYSMEQKNDVPVRMPLSKNITDILDEYMTAYRYDAYDTDPLFINQYQEAMTINSMGKALQHYNKKLGIEKTSVHLLRHTYAKEFIQSGGDALTLKKRLNHKTMDMVQQYVNLYSEDMRPIIEDIDPLKHYGAWGTYGQPRRKGAKKKVKLNKSEK